MSSNVTRSDQKKSKKSSGNNCGHRPDAPRFFAPPEKHANRPEILRRTQKAIQDYYLDGKKNEAAASVPDALIDEISLCGSADRIKDRLSAWQDAAKSGNLGAMVLKGASVAAMRVVAEAVL